MATKTCTCCGIEKDVDLFNIRKASIDGLTASCKQCISYRKKQLPSTKDYSKKYYQDNKDKTSDRLSLWRSKNKEHIALYKQAYRRDNKLKHTVWDANKRASRRQRKPLWLTKEDKVAISAFYMLAQEMSLSTGEKYQVDHIVPLNGKNVSGLHVPWNMQVITAIENNRKNNRHEQQAVPPQA